MAAKHILSLESYFVSNPEIFHLKDTSEYAKNLSIDCTELLITVPGYNKPALIEVSPGFDLTINACSLNIQTSNCGSSRIDIPDGLYIVRYSVAPNDKVYVEYNMLRTTSLMNMYYDKMCSIDVTTCLPSSEQSELMSEMSFIRTLIDAAKSKVEYCGSPSQGLELFEFAKNRLEKVTCVVC
tara:strand:+ start:3138 stop:3683 length:546 start_codon:yes stop_codon:yes gene_type:complete